MHTLAMINQKGGCGKTTTAINLSAGLAERGHNVLLVDMDPQAHATLGLGVNPDFLIESIYDVFGDSETSIRDIAMPVSDHIDLAASKFSLALVDQHASDQPKQHGVLRRALESCQDVYDFAVIDCPPNVGTLTLNALGACNEAVAVLETSFFSLHGISRLLETLAVVRKNLNPDVSVSVLATMYDRRTRFAKDVLREIRTHFGGKLYSSVIRTSVKLREAASAGLSIHAYDPRSQGSADYLALTDEVIERCKASLDDRLRERARSEQPAPEARAVPVKPPTASAADAPAAAIGGDEAGPTVKTASGPVRVAGGVLFTLNAPGATDVRLIGDFNNWDPTSAQMVKQDDAGLWAATIALRRGRFEYRYLVDGDWIEDPENPQFAISEYGGKNSIVVVEEDDEAGARSSDLVQPDPTRDEERSRARYGL